MRIEDKREAEKGARTRDILKLLKEILKNIYIFEKSSVSWSDFRTAPYF
jgi:hypothetical protein